MYEVCDIDKEILYWIDQFGYEWINCGKLIDYIKENLVVNDEHIINRWCEINEWKVDIDYLNWDKIIENDDDYEYLCNGLYLDVYQLEDMGLELKRLDLIK